MLCTVSSQGLDNPGENELVLLVKSPKNLCRRVLLNFKDAFNLGKIIACSNQKGGVGKTTTAVNLSAALGLLGKKVLLVDLDPQSNATSGVGVDKRSAKFSVYDILTGRAPAENAVIKTEFQNLFIIPSSISLVGAEIELVSAVRRESLLRTALGGIRDSFDYIFIDCPPSLGLITLNGLNAAEGVLIPLQCEYYALEGLSQLINTIRQVKEHYNPALDIEGILFTMFDGRLLLTNQVVSEVKKHFPKKIYKTIIPKNVKLSEAPSYGMPVCYYDRRSKGSESYLDLAKEYLNRQ